MAMGEFVKIYLLQQKIEIGIIYVLLLFNFLEGFFVCVKYILLCPEDISQMILQVQNWVTYPRKQFQKWHPTSGIVSPMLSWYSLNLSIKNEYIHQFYKTTLRLGWNIICEKMWIYSNPLLHTVRTNVCHNRFHQF